jgi:hypothetical protein
MLTFFLITVALLLFFIVLLLIGIVKKSRKPVYIAIFFFLLAIPSGIYTGFLFARKAYQKIKTTKIENPLKRSGMEMYTALLGQPETNCVTVINSQDQYIPKVDCCIWLEFTTCPKELARIIAQKDLSPLMGDNSIPDYSPKPKWFVPEKLGAEHIILRKNNPDDPNHDLILYFSKDSTRAFYCDMAE